MRTFVGIRLADELRGPFTSLCDELDRARVRVKWVEPENAHFTVRFLGEIGDEQMPAIAESLGAAVSTVSRFDIELRQVGAFPNVSRPRVLWIGIDPTDGPIADIKLAVDTALADHGFPEEVRAFHPHVTLGRVKDMSAAGLLEEPLRRVAETSFGTMEVRDVVFVQSTLTPHGAVYTDLRALPLGTRIRNDQ